MVGYIFSAINSVSPDFSVTLVPSYTFYTGYGTGFPILEFGYKSTATSNRTSYSAVGYTETIYRNSMRSASGNCCIPFVHTKTSINDSTNTSSQTFGTYRVEGSNLVCGVIAKGTGKLRIHFHKMVMGVYGSDPSFNPPRFYSENLDPYVTMEFEDGIYIRETHNFDCFQPNKAHYLCTQSISYIEEV